jgi:glycosyltransferase involved in cell wall biosynthesis
MRLSVIIPVWNEAATIEEVVRRVLAAPVEKEVIVVDDGSTDGSADTLAPHLGRQLTLLRLPRNSGKGAAVREGLKRATGDYVLVQDGDLELLPEEYPRLLAPIEAGRVEVVYGSRFLHGRKRTSWSHYLANRLLSGWANLLYGSALTDVSTAYKLLPRGLMERLDLRARRFEFCAEVTAKLLRLGVTPEEVPVTYTPRANGSGKKLRYLSDGLRAAWTYLRWRLWRPAPVAVPAPCTPPASPEG